MQGRTAAADLAARKDTERVALVDVRPPRGALPPRTEHVAVDVLRDPEGLRRAVAGASACLMALPGSLAGAALPTVVRAGVPTVDMSFTPEVLDAALSRAATEA